jgi:hypothetical protein
MIKPISFDEILNYLKYVDSIKRYQNTYTINNDEVIQAEQLSLFDTSMPEEERILNKIYEFEEIYFADLTLKDYKKDLTSYRKKVFKKWKTAYEDFFLDEKISFVDNKWRITFIDELLAYGFCSGKERIIGIAESMKDNVPNLVHEMIHGYESMLEPYAGYHQFVLIKLYEKLSVQITNLNKIIEWDMHTKNTVNHSPLFLLKSLDLDIRLKEPLGTVYCYDREYEFKRFNSYAVKYRLLNSNPPRKYNEFYGQLRFPTVVKAKEFIVRYQRKRIKKAIPKMIGFFPELSRPKPMEYSIFKIDKNNRYTILIETIRDEEVLDSLSISTLTKTFR